MCINIEETSKSFWPVYTSKNALRIKFCCPLRCLKYDYINIENFYAFEIINIFGHLYKNACRYFNSYVRKTKTLI